MGKIIDLQADKERKLDVQRYSKNVWSFLFFQNLPGVQ
jgi:hypothetical protein